MIAKNIISASPDKHRRGILVCELCNDLALREEHIILRERLRFSEGRKRPRDCNIIQERIGHALLIFLNEFGGIAALVSGHVNQLAVENRQLQTL